MRNFTNKVLARVLMCMVVISSGAMTVLAGGTSEGLILNYEIMRPTYSTLFDVAVQMLRVV